MLSSLSKGFLRRKQKKDKSTSKRRTGGADGGDDGDSQKSEGEDAFSPLGVNKTRQTPSNTDVDEEGYSRQPQTTGNDPWSDFNEAKKNFYSSSDDSGKRTVSFIL